MRQIRNKRIINYLAKYGVYPIEEYEDVSYYAASRRFFLLLDRYQIENYLIPNKL